MRKPIKGVDCFYYKNKKVKTIYIVEESLMVICDNKEILEELKKDYSDFFCNSPDFSYLLEENQEGPLVYCYEWNKNPQKRIEELIELEDKETIRNIHIEDLGCQKRMVYPR
ncbi:MAG: hypothetical protein GX641_01635 [Mollicutes bacterium]|nr:hypothetical protein [Mollicutes bacterium]